MFATPDREYDIIVRYSTGHGICRSDRAPSPRAIAIKVLGVEGSKALEGDQSANQDFLLVNRPIYFADVAAYARVQKLLLARQPGISDRLARIISFLSLATRKLFRIFGREAPIFVSALGDPGYNILGETFHSMAAIRFGDYIAKISAAPAPGSPALMGLVEKPVPSHHNALRDSVVEFFENNDAEYTLRAQLCTDLEKTPVEDASKEWREEDSPYQTIARIILPRQAADSPERRMYADEVLSFDAWRCLAAHRPLGSIMRLRRQAYKTSDDFRHKMNARRPVEPRDIAELPA